MKCVLYKRMIICRVPDTCNSVESALLSMGYNIQDERQCKIGYARGIKCFVSETTTAGTTYRFDSEHTFLVDINVM